MEATHSVKAFFLSLFIIIIIGFAAFTVVIKCLRKSDATCNSRRSIDGPCEVSGGQSGAGTGFLPNPSVFFRQHISSLFHIHQCIVWGMDKGAVSGCIPHTVSPHPKSKGKRSKEIKTA
jgi:hypothetical protein